MLKTKSTANDHHFGVVVLFFVVVAHCLSCLTFSWLFFLFGLIQLLTKPLLHFRFVSVMESVLTHQSNRRVIHDSTES